MINAPNRIHPLLYIGAAFSFIMAIVSFVLLIYDHYEYQDYLEKKKESEFWSEISETTKEETYEQSKSREKAATEPASPAIANQAKAEFVVDEAFGPVFASKRSKKFHHPDCKALTKINPDNIVKYQTVKAANEAGLSPAVDCRKQYQK